MYNSPISSNVTKYLKHRYSVAMRNKDKLETLASSQFDLLRHLKDNWKFSIPDNVLLCRNCEDIDHALKTFDRMRSDLAYDMDGVVFKMNSIRTWCYLFFVVRTTP